MYHYIAGQKIPGPPPSVSGDLTGVHGNLSGVSGDLSGVWGNLTGVQGDLSDCDLSDRDRQKGVDIRDLIDEKEEK